MKSLSGKEQKTLEELFTTLKKYESDVQSAPQERKDIINRVKESFKEFGKTPSSNELQNTLADIQEDSAFTDQKKEYVELVKRINALQLGSIKCKQTFDGNYRDIEPRNIFDETSSLNTSLKNTLEIGDEEFDIAVRIARWTNILKEYTDQLDSQKGELNRNLPSDRSSTDYKDKSAQITALDAKKNIDSKLANAYFYTEMRKHIEAKKEELAQQLKEKINIKTLEADENSKKITELARSMKKDFSEVKEWMMLKLKFALYDAALREIGSSQTGIKTELTDLKSQIDARIKRLPFDTKTTTGGASSFDKTLDEIAQTQTFNVIPYIMRAAFSDDSLSHLSQCPTTDNVKEFSKKFEKASYDANKNEWTFQDKSKEKVTSVEYDALKAFICVEIIKGYREKSKLKRTDYEKSFTSIIDDIKRKYPGLFKYMDNDSKLSSFIEDLKREMTNAWRKIEFDEPTDLGGEKWNDTVVPTVLKAMKEMSSLFKASELPDWVKTIPETHFAVMYEKIAKLSSSKTLFGSTVIEAGEGDKKEEKSVVEQIFEGVQKQVGEGTKGGKDEEKPLGGLLDLFNQPDNKK